MKDLLLLWEIAYTWYLNALSVGINRVQKIRNPVAKVFCAFFTLLLMIPLICGEIFSESVIQWKTRGMPDSGTSVRILNTNTGDLICVTTIYDLCVPDHHFHVEVNGHWHIAHRNGTVGRDHLNMRWEI